MIAKEIEMSEIKGDPTDWVEFVLERFIYNYETHSVHWKSKYAADGCGSLISQGTNGRGYFQTNICGRTRLVHQVVWILTTGKKPIKGLYIDHIDWNKQNNAYTNLREVDQATNVHNQMCKGYYWHKRRKKWKAQIVVNGKQQYLGQFTTEEEARAAYVAAKKLHGFIHR